VIRYGALLLMGTASIAFALPARQVISVHLAADGSCHARFAKQEIPADKGMRAGWFRRAGLDSHRTVHLNANAAVPYACVGGLIYSLQAAGYARIGFTAQPPTTE
jgi:biopolymer transport protein ExbD